MNFQAEYLHKNVQLLKVCLSLVTTQSDIIHEFICWYAYVCPAVKETDILFEWHPVIQSVQFLCTVLQSQFTCFKYKTMNKNN